MVDPDMSELLEMLSGLLSVMNRDAVKHIEARNTFIVSSARRNSLMFGKSSWSRTVSNMKYHPYWPIKREELKP